MHSGFKKKVTLTIVNQIINWENGGVWERKRIFVMYFIQSLPMQFVAHKLEVFQQLLSSLTILPLFFVSQEIVWYHLRVQTSTYIQLSLKVFFF